MKITSVELLPASKYLFIKVHTDSGIYGTGEVGAWGYLDGCVGILKKMEGYLIGQDPFRIEHHWNYLYRSMYFRGSILMSALSAIDIALWDIKGKAMGVPVYELLGGKCRDKVRSYEACFQFTPETMAKRCLEIKEMGFDAYWDGACSADKIREFAPKGVKGFVLGTTLLFGKKKSYKEALKEIRKLAD